jgi:hypothetical protein
MSPNELIQKKELILDAISIIIVGTLCMLYSLLSPAFAEIHIQLPFLDFPIFIGEISLTVLLFLWLAKFILAKTQLAFFHYITCLFLLFIIIKALWGYFKWGPLALRNSAMFYYFLFSVFTFYSFNKDFFNKKFIILFLFFLLLILVGFLGKGKIGNYAGFTYCCLILGLTFAIKNRFIKVIGFGLGFYFLSILLRSGPKSLFLSCWAGFLFMVCSFIYLIFITTHKLRKRYLFTALLISLSVISVFIFKIDENMKGRLRFWANFSNIIKEYKRQISYIAPYDSVEDIPYRGEKYDYLWPKYVKPRLYEDESLTKESMYPQPIKSIKLKEERIKKQRAEMYALLDKINQTFEELLEMTEKKRINRADTDGIDEKIDKNIIFIKDNIYRIEYMLKRLASASSHRVDERIASIETEMEIIRNKVDTLLHAEIREPLLMGKLYKKEKEEKTKEVDRRETVTAKAVSKAYDEEKAKTALLPTKTKKPKEVSHPLPSKDYKKEEEKKTKEKTKEVDRRETISEMVASWKELLDYLPTEEVEKQPEVRNFRTPQGDVNTTLWRLFLWRDIFNELFRKKAIFGIDFGKPLRSPTMEKLRYLTGIGWSLGDWLGWVEPHNSYIHILYRTGIVGLVFIIVIWTFFVRMFLSFIKNRSFIGITLSAAIFCYLILSNFIVFLELPRFTIPFWCLLGFTYAYSKQIKKSKHNETLSS